MNGRRRAIDAAVMAVLPGPMRRWSLTRLRTAARNEARSRFGDRARAAWHSSALSEQLASLRSGKIPEQLASLRVGELPEQLSAIQLGPLPDPLAALRTSALAASLGIKPKRDRRDIVVAAVMAGTVAAVVTAAAFTVAAVVRSRRRDALGPADASAKRVAVPVVVPDGEQQDELRSIRGIGSVSAERLRGIGIMTVAQIAAWRPEDIQRIADQIELSPERIEREDWVGQARSISGAETATDLA